MDEHRLGLKPILGKVWARRGESLVVRVQHRYEWLYLYAFACPEQGHSHFKILPGVNTIAFECVLNAFARDNGVGPDKHSVLVLDQAGWHVSGKLKVPEGITLVFLPSHAPELQRLGENGTVLDKAAPCKLEEGLSTIDRTAPGPLRSSDSKVVVLTHFQQSPNGCLEISGTYRAISRLGENGTVLG